MSEVIEAPYLWYGASESKIDASIRDAHQYKVHFKLLQLLKENSIQESKYVSVHNRLFWYEDVISDNSGLKAPKCGIVQQKIATQFNEYGRVIQVTISLSFFEVKERV